MLRLNHSTAWHTPDNHKIAFGLFDEVTKSGKVKVKHAEQYSYKDGVLELNGVIHQLDMPVDIDTEPENLMTWFKKVTAKGQVDMFDLLAPTTDGSETVDINNLKWEYPEYEWRAVDKHGSIPYFKNRPTLDGAGYWIVYDTSEYPKYSDYLASDSNDYKRSLRRRMI